MQDFLLKYGLLVVALIVAASMTSFAFNSLYNAEPSNAFDQSVVGDNTAITKKIVQLCDSCLENKQAIKECYILSVSSTKGQYVAPPQPKNYKLQFVGNVNSKNFRIENSLGTCVVRSID